MKLLICAVLLVYPFAFGRVYGATHHDAHINFTSDFPIPRTLWGIFFEEINHAGEGGLHAEMVQDRSFEGQFYQPSSSKAWSFVGNSTEFKLMSDGAALNPTNPVYARVGTHENSAGISNTGFWGMNSFQHTEFVVSFFCKIKPDSSAWTIKAQLVDDSANVLGEAPLIYTGSGWTKLEGTISVPEAKTFTLSIVFEEPGIYDIDVVSLMPQENKREGHPFRSDLVDKLKSMSPAFMRFPGGCYVEGQVLKNSFKWKPSVGPVETRPGHFNDVWGYWTSDGLGYYEFLVLTEMLDTEPIWVINNGISHEESVSPRDIMPEVKSALESLEFAMGDVSSEWGQLRASMGHSEPFDIKYMAIGNEDCGKPDYVDDYIAFFSAIRTVYPDIQLISNCDMKETAPQDLWDYHVYTSFEQFTSTWNSTFEMMPRETTSNIFVSEYAITTGAGNGNFRAALGEAAWMVGMERNSDLIKLASYAPLFVNDNDRHWNPDAIVFNGYESYGTPSYHLQTMFAKHDGGDHLPVHVSSTDTTVNATVAMTAAFVQREGSGGPCADDLLLKVVNYGNEDTIVSVTLDASFQSLLPLTPVENECLSLHADSLDDENSFDDREKVAPTVIANVKSIASTSFTLPVPNATVQVLLFSQQKDGDGVLELVH